MNNVSGVESLPAVQSKRVTEQTNNGGSYNYSGNWARTLNMEPSKIVFKTKTLSCEMF